MTNKKLGRSLWSLSLLGLIHAAGFVACLCSLFGFLGEFHWLLDLFAHFRIQYTLFFLILTLLALSFKQRPAILIYGGFLALNFFQLVPFYLGQNKPEPDARVYRLLFFNLLSSNKEHEAVFRFIRESNPDIIVLAEVSPLWQQQLASLKKEWPYHRQEARGDNFGIAFFSRIEPESLEVVYLSRLRLPSVCAVIPFGPTQLTVLGTHPVPPLGERGKMLQNHQLTDIAAFMNANNGPKLLAGDLNNTPWASGFQRLLKETGLKNASKGRGIHASFPAWLGRFGIPIDHVLHSSDVIIHKKRIGPQLGSDHRAVVVDFSFRTN